MIAMIYEEHAVSNNFAYIFRKDTLKKLGPSSCRSKVPFTVHSLTDPVPKIGIGSSRVGVTQDQPQFAYIIHREGNPISIGSRVYPGGLGDKGWISKPVIILIFLQIGKSDDQK